MRKRSSFRESQLVLNWSTRALFIASVIAFLSDSAVNAQSEGVAQQDKAKPVAVETAKKPTQYLRMTKDSDGKPLALQTAITRFQPRDSDVIVDLIAAVHIGEAEYYRQLEEQFSLYEVVLYELVANDKAPRPDGKPRAASGNPLAFLQQSAQSMLGLESQLENIDYRKSNFVHADLSPAEMSAKMAARGESALSIGLNTLSELLSRSTSEQAQQMSSQFGDTGLLELLNDPLKLKQIMATQFASDDAMELGLGTKLNRLLISDRNAEAVRVLRQQLKSGKQHIAIFYGAAHMPDFAKRFRSELGMKQTDQIWVTAWDLTQANPAGDSPASGILKWLGEMGK